MDHCICSAPRYMVVGVRMAKGSVLVGGFVYLIGMMTWVPVFAAQDGWDQEEKNRECREWAPRQIYRDHVKKYPLLDFEFCFPDTDELVAIDDQNFYYSLANDWVDLRISFFSLDVLSLIEPVAGPGSLEISEKNIKGLPATIYRFTKKDSDETFPRVAVISIPKVDGSQTPLTIWADCLDPEVVNEVTPWFGSIRLRGEESSTTEN